VRRVLVAEWTKLRTLPSTAVMFGAVTVLLVGLSAVVVSGLSPDDCLQRAGSSCDADVVKTSLVGVYLGQVAAVLIGVLAVTAEYETATIRATLAAVPRRVHVLAAKAATVTALVLAASTLGVLGALVVGRNVLPDRGFTPANGYPLLSLVDEQTRRAYLGTVLYLGLIALLSLGIGTAVRYTGAAITAVVGLLFVAPIVASVVTDARWHERILKYSPMTAGLSVQATKRLAEQPVAPWTGLGVLAAYAGVALVLGAWLLVRRDA
jgi:ABC-2 type transport system permease protein